MAVEFQTNFSGLESSFNQVGGIEKQLTNTTFFGLAHPNFSLYEKGDVVGIITSGELSAPTNIQTDVQLYIIQPITTILEGFGGQGTDFFDPGLKGKANEAALKYVGAIKELLDAYVHVYDQFVKLVQEVADSMVNNDAKNAEIIENASEIIKQMAMSEGLSGGSQTAVAQGAAISASQLVGSNTGITGTSSRFGEPDSDIHPMLSDTIPTSGATSSSETVNTDSTATQQEESVTATENTTTETVSEPQQQEVVTNTATEEVAESSLVSETTPPSDNVTATTESTEVQTATAEVQETSSVTQNAAPAAPNSGWDGPALTKSMGVNQGPSGKETYYNLDMSGIVRSLKEEGYQGDYWVRDDGVKMFGDYVMVAANLDVYPRGSIIESSLGPAIVCDTGGFAANNPNQIDIATTWINK